MQKKKYYNIPTFLRYWLEHPERIQLIRRWIYTRMRKKGLAGPKAFVGLGGEPEPQKLSRLRKKGYLSENHHVVLLHRNTGQSRTFLIGNLTGASNLSATPT